MTSTEGTYNRNTIHSCWCLTVKVSNIINMNSFRLYRQAAEHQFILCPLYNSMQAVEPERADLASEPPASLSTSDHIRRLEQWSSLDSCIIPNRTRIPSARVVSHRSQPTVEDVQIALNLLQVEGKSKQRKHSGLRSFSSGTESSSVCASSISNPFRTRTPSAADSLVFPTTSNSASSNSGSVVIHSRNFLALEKLLRDQNIPHEHMYLEGQDDQPVGSHSIDDDGLASTAKTNSATSARYSSIIDPLNRRRNRSSVNVLSRNDVEGER